MAPCGIARAACEFAVAALDAVSPGASDDGTNCTGQTPLCDTSPASAHYGQCVAPIVDAGVGSDSGTHLDAGPDAASGGQVCIPGQQVACACVGGESGAQVCVPNGTGYGVCECPDAGATNAAPVSNKSGCGCHVGTQASGGWLGVLLALSAVILRRRKYLFGTN